MLNKADVKEANNSSIPKKKSSALHGVPLISFLIWPPQNISKSGIPKATRYLLIKISIATRI